MRTSFFTGLLAAWTAAVAAAPQRKGEGYIAKTRNNEGTDSTEAKSYIVLYEKNATTPFEELIARLDDIDETVIVRRYDNSEFYGAEILVGPASADAFSAMAEVAIVEEKVSIKTFDVQEGTAPWGLQRISNEAGASGSPEDREFTYTFDGSAEGLGAGVDVYIVDTGIFTDHRIFRTTDNQTTRVQDEFFSFTDSVADGDGHGTHCAGTAAGYLFGVSQGANIIGVKVLGDDGSGSSADTIAGMDWIINRHNERKNSGDFKGSVMSMSWGLSGTAATVDRVVLDALDAGIHVSVAAGNDGADACDSTPSHNGGANSAVVTVGSVNIDNQVSSFSNIGTCVDIYAPGEQILSSWNTGESVVNFLSGTSMACPHVSGVMAYLLASAEGSAFKTDPAGLKAKLLEMARKDAFTGETGGSENLLLSNGEDGGVPLAKRAMKKWVVPSSGSPAAKARDIVDKRWMLHSEKAQLRY